MGAIFFQCTLSASITYGAEYVKRGVKASRKNDMTYDLYLMHQGELGHIGGIEDDYKEAWCRAVLTAERLSTNKETIGDVIEVRKGSALVFMTTVFDPNAYSLIGWARAFVSSL